MGAEKKVTTQYESHGSSCKGLLYNDIYFPLHISVQRKSHHLRNSTTDPAISRHCKESKTCCHQRDKIQKGVGKEAFHEARPASEILTLPVSSRWVFLFYFLQSRQDLAPPLLSPTLLFRTMAYPIPRLRNGRHRSLQTLLTSENT